MSALLPQKKLRMAMCMANTDITTKPRPSSMTPTFAKLNRTACYGLALLALLGLGACSPLSVLNATAGSNFQKTANQAYGADARQKLDVFVPQMPVANADVVLFIYGGRWQYGSKEEYRFVADGLAEKGFISVIPDYRLYPQVDWRDFIADTAAAYRWVETHIATYGGNPQRIFIMGHSAGAHMAAMVALDPALRQKTGSQRPPCGMIGLAGPYDFLPIEDADVQQVFSSAKPLITSQPIYYATHIGSPMLLLTGDADTIVKPGNTYRMAKAVQAHGGKAEVLSYPEVGHIDIMLALSRSLSFLAPSLQDSADFIRKTTCN